METSEHRLKQMILDLAEWNDTPGRGYPVSATARRMPRLGKYLIDICEELGLTVRVDVRWEISLHGWKGTDP